MGKRNVSERKDEKAKLNACLQTVVLYSRWWKIDKAAIGCCAYLLSVIQLLLMIDSQKNNRYTIYCLICF